MLRDTHLSRQRPLASIGQALVLGTLAATALFVAGLRGPLVGGADLAQVAPASERSKAITLDYIAADAVLAAVGHAPARARAGGPAGLTARESDVLVLLAQGLPNKAIARQLAISPKTVSNHVEHIYAKIGAPTRAAAGLFAMQHGLLPEEEFPTRVAA